MVDDDVLQALIEWEVEGLDESPTVVLFQRLVDSGLAWQLQGAYGREAVRLIEAGLVRPATSRFEVKVVTSCGGTVE